MKKLSCFLFCVFVIVISHKSFAQHFLQLDDGLGHYSIITSSNPGGSYILPPGGGTLLTSGTTWTTAGNLLTGGTPSTPNEFFGSTNNYDVIFKTFNTARMTLAANGYIGIGIAPTYPLTVFNADASANPPNYTEFFQTNLSPSGTVVSNRDGMHLVSFLFSSSSNFSAVLDGIRQETYLQPDYTGTLDYAQGGNFAIYDKSPTTLAVGEGLIGSAFAQGATAANIITSGRGTTGQVFNLGPGTIVNAYSHLSRMGNNAGGSITNGFLFYGVNPNTPGITNLTGLYLEQLTAATNMNAIVYAHPVLPFVVSGTGNVGIGTLNPGVGAKLSFGHTTGSPADIYFWDNGVAASKYGIGMQGGELQSFIPVGAHFSWNFGGDLQASGTNESMKLTSSGNLRISGNTFNISTALALVTPTTGYQINSLTVLHNTGLDNIFVGNLAGNVVGTGQQNTGLGFQALQSLTTGGSNTASGYQALGSVVSNDGNSAFGSSAAVFTTGSNNTAVGSLALFNNTSGSGNVGLGQNAGLSNSTEDNNTFISSNTNGAAGITNATAIGANAYVGKSNCVVIGSISGINGAVASANVGIGTFNPGVGTKLSFGQTTGSPADIYFWDDGTPNNKYGIGMQGSELQSFIPTVNHFSWNSGGDLQPSGTNELMRLTGSGNLNVLSLINIVNATTATTGYQIQGSTILHNTGTFNTFLGTQTGTTIGAGTDNTATGNQALFVITAGSFNTASGSFALASNQTGNDNTAIGASAMVFSSGDNNTAVGAQAGLSNGTGSNNTFLGINANVSAGNLTNATAIGANAQAAASNSLVLGFQAKVGIGISAPHSLLHVQDGDVEVSDNANPSGTHGIILKSPNGNCWRVTVNNFGGFNVVAIACP
jgi:hypothetical protein